ncbi:YbaN family protein [Coralloluteibacterium thermophilus]|uniref:Inner membrane protein n=1 Tax=Coralloluteibacterium thermophilum TaxID=2707049 RepID=A0ABV9NK96_9GAMM
MRWLWLAAAYLFLVLGLIGAVLPGMPTTVFILLAAWAATNGSPRLRAWLMRHRVFGPTIRDWEAHGAVGRRAKWMATLAMAVCAVIAFLFAPRWAAWLSVAVMGAVATWLWYRPEPPPDAPEPGER